METKSIQDNFWREISTQKKCEETSPKNLWTETFPEKGAFSTQTITTNLSQKNKVSLYQKSQKKFDPKNIWREIVYQKNLKTNPYQKISEEKSLLKKFSRDISTQKISEEISTKKSKKAWPKKNIWKNICKKVCREISAKKYFKKNLYGKNLGDICTSKSVKKTPPKYVWKDISRDISTNKIEKRNL